MKIALIAAGALPIPPQGWGGVENYLWLLKQSLESLGVEVVIFNTKDIHAVAKAVNEGGFDFVHLHHERHTKFFRKNLNQPFCVTSHFGYTEKKNKWSIGFYALYSNLFSAPGIISISDRISQQFLRDGYIGKLYTVPVGTTNANFARGPKGNGKALVLGKVEARKRQAWLSRVLDGKVQIDFVGPLADPDFKEGGTTKYLGVWDKPTLYRQLTEYSVFVLFSDGEAAPAVVPEALSAGLSLVVSEAASANLAPKPFISILPDDETDAEKIAGVINAQIKANEVERGEISVYAGTFDLQEITKHYIAVATDFAATAPKSKRAWPKGGPYDLHYWYSYTMVVLRDSLAGDTLAGIRNMYRKLLKYAKG